MYVWCVRLGRTSGTAVWDEVELRGRRFLEQVWGRAIGAAVASGFLFVGASGALASGFQLKEQSAEGLGNAFAGSTAKALDMSTIFFNPAGMTNLDKSGFEGSVSFISPNSSVTVNSATNTGEGGAVTGGDAGDPSKDAYLPVMYGMWSYSDDLKFGLGVTVPFGLKTEYDENWEGRFSAIKSELKTANIQPTIAYKVSDWMSVGVGAQIEVATAELTNQTSLAPLLGAGVDSLSGLKSKQSLAFGYSLGLMFEPIENTRIGLSYRSRVKHTLKGDISFSNAVAQAALGGEGEAQITLPDVASIGIYSEITPQLALMADAAWTNWSVFDEIRIDSDNPLTSSNTPLNYEDTYFVSVGATYRPIENLALQVGAAYDKSPTNDEFRTARIPDSDRYWISFGAGYEIDEWLSVNAGYSHIFVDDTRVREDVTSATGVTTTLDASYEASIHLVSVGGSLRF